MNTQSQPPAIAEKSSTLEWYEDPVKLREKREALGVSVERLARIVGRHKSYVEEVESGRIPLVWEDGGEAMWSYLIELQLNQGRTTPLAQALEAPHGQRSHADLLDEIKQLREIRRVQYEQLANLKEQSSCWEELAIQRLETIRELRIELGQPMDEDEEL